MWPSRLSRPANLSRRPASLPRCPANLPRCPASLQGPPPRIGNSASLRGAIASLRRPPASLRGPVPVYGDPQQVCLVGGRNVGLLVGRRNLGHLANGQTSLSAAARGSESSPASSKVARQTRAGAKAAQPGPLGRLLLHRRRDQRVVAANEMTSALERALARIATRGHQRGKPPSETPCCEPVSPREVLRCAMGGAASLGILCATHRPTNRILAVEDHRTLHARRGVSFSGPEGRAPCRLSDRERSPDPTGRDGCSSPKGQRASRRRPRPAARTRSRVRQS